MKTIDSKSDELERRLISFAATILSLSSRLPKSPQGRHVRDQILRSGTAAAANYGEARGAESRADFVHKLKVVFKELNETTMARSDYEEWITRRGVDDYSYRRKSTTLPNHRRINQNNAR
jgi:hypothetical protein